MSFWIWSWVLVLVAGGRGGGSPFRYTHGLLILSILQRTPVVVSEDPSLSVSRAGWAALSPASPLPPVPPTLRLRCYDASALGASLRPFFRDGESDVFAVLQGGLTGSLGSSWSDGSLYMATAWRQTEAVSATDWKHVGFIQAALGTPTLYNFRQEMCSSFVLLYPVALHDLTITVDTDIPAAARLRLAVEHGGVRNVVVLKHTLLELTLRSEVLL